MRRWINFGALLLLLSVGVVGSFLVTRDVPIPDDITFLLFGTGIISSAILLKTEKEFNDKQGQNLREHLVKKVWMWEENPVNTKISDGGKHRSSERLKPSIPDGGTQMETNFFEVTKDRELM